MFAFTSIYMDFRDNNEECFVNKLVVTGVSVNGFIPLTDMLLTKKVPKIAIWMLRRNVKVPHSFVNGYIQ